MQEHDQEEQYEEMKVNVEISKSALYNSESCLDFSVQ
jgi:hypothetical protein